MPSTRPVIVLTGTRKQPPNSSVIIGPSATRVRSNTSSRSETSSRLANRRSVSLKRVVSCSMKRESSSARLSIATVIG